MGRTGLMGGLPGLWGGFAMGWPGPGFIGGATFGTREGDTHYRPQLAGTALEFYDRLRRARDDMPDVYAVVSHAASRAAIEMCRERDVTLVLSAFASDPMLEDNRVCGLFVETKSGTVAFPAKVVVDATGDADVGLDLEEALSVQGVLHDARGQFPANLTLLARIIHLSGNS